MVNVINFMQNKVCVSILVLVACMCIASFLIELSRETLARICTFARIHTICSEYD